MDAIVTPPVSPEASRLVTKRRCPFGESPRQCKIAATDQAKNIYSSLNKSEVEQDKQKQGKRKFQFFFSLPTADSWTF